MQSNYFMSCLQKRLFKYLYGSRVFLVAAVTSTGTVTVGTCLPCAFHSISGDHDHRQGASSPSNNGGGIRLTSATRLASAASSSVAAATNSYQGEWRDASSDVPVQVKLGCASAVSAASGLLDLLLQALDEEAAVAESSVSECLALVESAPLASRPDVVSDRLTATRTDARDSLARLHRLRSRADAAIAGLSAAVAAAFACDAEAVCRRGSEQLASAEAVLAEFDARLAGLRRRLTDAVIGEISSSDSDADGGGDDGEDGEDDDDASKLQ